MSCLSCHRVTRLLPSWPFPAPLHLYSLSSSLCLQGLSAAPQVRPSPLRSPLLSTLGASSYYQLWPDVDLAVAIFQTSTRRAATGTAFDVSAAVRDALCMGIVNCFPRRSTGEPRSPVRPVGRSPAHQRGAPLAPPSSSVPGPQPADALRQAAPC